MAAEVELDVIIEALEMADDSISSYLDVEAGEVHSITEEEGKRYMALPDKFDVHEWAMMDRFSMSLRDGQMRNDFNGGTRGAGAFRLFKHLLTEYDLWDGWNRFKQVELRQMAIEWCKENGITYRQA